MRRNSGMLNQAWGCRRICLMMGVFVVCCSGMGQEPGAEKRPVNRIGILGCLRQGEPSPGLFRYLEAAPDLCLWVGDNIYADTLDDPGVLEASYESLAARPVFQELRKMCEFAVTWDDHDFGNDNEGKNYPLKEFSKNLFRAFWGLRELIPEERDGIYHVRRFAGGKDGLQIILLDPRYNRDDEGPMADTLGENQWHWLENQLRQPASLRLIVSGYQILLHRDVSSETWSKFPKAKARLFDLIRSTGAENVIFITGDQHYAEAIRVPQALDVDAFELQFSGINQIEKAHLNPWRQTPVIKSRHSYCLMDIQWEENETDVPHIQFTVRDALSDNLELSYRINLHDLNLKLDMTGSREFVDQAIFMAGHNYPNLDLRYTDDGSAPVSTSPVLREAVTVTETTLFKLALFTESGQRRSQVYESHIHKVRPKPAYSLNGGKAGLRYEYREGAFLRIGETYKSPVLRKGITPIPEIREMDTAEDHFSVHFSGFVELPESDVYTFELTSDDGSRLSVHETLLIDNDGSHSAVRRSGSMALAAGSHPVRIEYFEDYMGQKLQLDVLDSSGELVPVRYWHLEDLP